MTSALKGRSIIAGEHVVGAGQRSTAYNPATGQALEPAYTSIDESQLRTATRVAAAAFRSFSRLDPDTHANFIDAIARNIDAIGEQLSIRIMAETGLPRERTIVERTRTVNQLRLFADVVRQGDFRGVRWDPSMPGREPAPRPDVRAVKVAIGPVAVFGASNFPLAFSVAGGDTASALAAGCPVIVKAHDAHPGTSELVGTAITAAVTEAGLDPGVFSLIYGPGRSIGQALVADPVISAVGFTGSRTAGLALMQVASARKVPIPVYAEMSSINPVLFLDSALDTDASGLEELASSFLSTMTGSSGQFCTQPGLLFIPRSAQGDALVAAIARATSNAVGQTMLTASICESWYRGVAQLADQSGVDLVAQGTLGQTRNAPAPVVYEVLAEAFAANPVLQEEIFGAASLIVRYESVEELSDTVRRLEGQLTATLHLTDADHEAAAMLLPILEQKAGRILANGWPPGVEVSHATVHGGPFPATSDSRTTSVGSLAIERFLRPVAYQNLPESFLPPAVATSNPWGLNRRIDGHMHSATPRA